MSLARQLDPNERPFSMLTHSFWDVPDSDIADGVPPLNYQARDRKLVIVESETEIAASSAAMPNSARYDC